MRFSLVKGMTRNHPRQTHLTIRDNHNRPDPPLNETSRLVGGRSQREAIMQFLAQLFRPAPRARRVEKNRPSANRPRTQLLVEALEARWVPSGFSSITANFAGPAIPAGDTVWLSSAFKVKGLGAAAVHLDVTNQSISYTIKGTSYSLAVPDAHVTFSPAATTATTTFDAASNAWDTTLPMSFSGNAFLGGVALPVTSKLPAGNKVVTWSGQFSSDTAGLKVNWQWDAGVYARFGTDYNALGVKPVDDNHLSQYRNSDHAGTPEAFKAFDLMDGSSGTASVVPPVVQQVSSLAGKVTNENTHAGYAGLTVTLTGTDANGNAVSLTTTTAADGTYSFANLAAGTYNLSVTDPSGYSDAGAVVGSVNGNKDGTYGGPGSFSIGSISLGAGQNGTGYNFGLIMLMA